MGNATAVGTLRSADAPSARRSHVAYPGPMTPRVLLALGASVLSAALLGGCGSDGDAAADDTASESPSAPSGTTSEATDPSESATGGGFPDCAKVWRAGRTLPEDYLGCVEGTTPFDLDGIECESGQFIVKHDERFWAVAGGRIAKADSTLLKDPDYTDDLATCRG